MFLLDSFNEWELMENKGRNNLLAVKQYLQHGTFPKDCKKVDRRAVRKRSQTFVFTDNQLYYTGGRPKRSGCKDGEEDSQENPESHPDYTQVLRKCCITEEEKQEAVMQCHIGDDGTHFGMEKTTERVSNEYYWVGIINTVRKVLHSCDFCVARGIRCSGGIFANPMVSISQDSSMIKLETELGEEPDVFSVPQEPSKCFWQKVEVQIFGPYSSTTHRKQVYVAVALDCYSQFPEAMIIDSISAATLTTFVLNLICRYGVMEKLCMLQNKTTKDIYLYINMQDLEIADITPTFQSQHASPADERWQRVSQHLERFVLSYPKMWDRCLEAFMVPLRVSLPPQADYAPAYLTFNREPVLPEKLSHKSDTACNSEVCMSEADEKQTVDLLMSAYGNSNKVTAIQPADIDLDISLLPSVKLEPLTTVPDGDVLNLEEATIVPVTFEQELQHPPRRSQRNRTKAEENVNAVVEETNDVYGGTTDDETSDHHEDCIDFDEDDRDETYHPGSKSHSAGQNQSGIVTRSSNRKRTLTYKARAGMMLQKKRKKAQRLTQSAPIPEEPPQLVKRKRGRPPKVRSEPQEPKQEEDVQTAEHVEYIAKQTSRGTTAVALTSSGLMNSVEQLDLDLYYMIIKCYKERNAYPPRVSVDFKRAVRRLAETVVLKDGKLYGNVGKAAGRLIIMKERERFCLLRKAHAKGEEHVGRVRVLKTLLDMNVFWKGMSLDLDAFIHSCPECVCNNPLRNKIVVRIPTLSKVVTQKDHEGDPHMSEDEEEESSYEDLIQYLTDNTFPPNTSSYQQSRIQQRSQAFCIINGSLYYKSRPGSDSQPRQVLFSEKNRQVAMQEAHVEDGNHLSQQDTQIKVRRQYFWSGMTYDVMRYVMACCMTKRLMTVPVEHRSAIIQQRVNKFRKYYKEGIPDIASETEAIGEMFSGTNVQDNTDTVVGPEDSAEQEVTAEKKTETSNTSGNVATEATADPRTVKEDQIIRKAMEAVIVKMGGERSKDTTEQKTHQMKSTASTVTRSHEPLSSDQVPVRRAKARHKCDHCGRVVKGDVAFKVHLYKHTGIKPFSCSVCGKSFSNRKSQRIHMRKHTGVKPYLCNQCGREFFRSASLRYHLKAHATGRGTPVCCDICGRSFTTQHRLIRHKEFKHPAQAKVYMCNQCGKHFTAARSLKRHEQTHTGYRRFQCQYCSKAFFRKEYLNSHLTNHAEYDPELEKLKPRKKSSKKPQPQTETVNVTTVVIPGPSGDTVPSNVIHWTETEQPVHRLEDQNVTDLDEFQHQTVSIQPALSTSQVLSPTHISHLPSGNAVSHSQTVHHTLHHPIAHTTRVMNVAGPHGPLSVTVSAARPSIEVVHAGNGQEILLQHDAVPVQYEVECFSGAGDPATLSEADINAIRLLAQASMSGGNLHTV